MPPPFRPIDEQRLSRKRFYNQYRKSTAFPQIERQSREDFANMFFFLRNPG